MSDMLENLIEPKDNPTEQQAVVPETQPPVETIRYTNPMRRRTVGNKFGLKSVEGQNEALRQVSAPIEEMENEIGTPLTQEEFNVISNIYVNSTDKDRDLVRIGEALEYKRNYGLSLDYTYNNLDAINEARGVPKELNWSNFSAVKNSLKIGSLSVEISDLSKKWMDAEMRNAPQEELDAIDAQIVAKEQEMESLRDYAPRSAITTMFKWAAESTPFTLSTLGHTIGWTAATGLGLATAAAMSGVPIVGAPLAIGALTMTELMAASAVGGKVMGMSDMAHRMTGTMYRQLRQQGIEKDLAGSVATINGYLNSAIEMSFGVLPAAQKGVMMATGVDKITAKALGRLFARGSIGAFIKTIGGHVEQSLEEGGEEFEQSVLDDLSEAIATTVSEECKRQGVKYDKSVKDIIKDGLKAGWQGFCAALVMSTPTTVLNTRTGIKEAKILKAEAKLNPSEQDFVNHHENDSNFEGMEKKDVRDMLHQMYKAQNEVPVEDRIDQTTIDSDVVEENADIESEEDEEAVASEVPEQELKRMENGRIRTQESKDFDVDLNGNEKHTLNVGTPNSSTRYGRVEYTVKPDGSIEIDKVATKAGFQKAVTKDAVLELMRRYAGQEVTWNPTNAYQQKIKTELENENGGKLQRFASEYNQSEEAELGDFLHEKYGKQFTPTQGKLVYGLYKNIAQHYGQTIHEMIADAKANNPRAALRFRYMSDAVKEGLINEKQARRRGLIDYANRVIYVGENGDITTLFHEGFHMLSKVDKEGAQGLVKAIAESKDMEAYFKSHRAFFVPTLGLTVDEIMKELSNLSEDSDKWTERQDEILTSMFEAYLRDGKTLSKKLENIFSRIADFFVHLYKTLAGGNHLNDNIIKAFDRILEGNPELQQKYESQAEGVRAQGEGEIRFQRTNAEQELAMTELENFSPEEQKRISGNLKRLKGTPWYNQAIEALLIRKDIRSLMNGEEPTAHSKLMGANSEKAREAIKRGMRGVLEYCESTSFIGHPEKPMFAVNSSLLNCDPSLGCAKFCYASKGNFVKSNPSVKAEMIALAVEMFPEEAAESVAYDFKRTPDGMAGKFLRLFDKGDMNEKWIPFIKELNRRGVLCTIFSKRPALLSLIDQKKNCVMLSIDDTNLHLAEQYPNLPVAYVYHGTQDDIDFLNKNRERYEKLGGSILPIELGGEPIPRELVNKIPDWAKRYRCPINSGLRVLHYDENNGLTPEENRKKYGTPWHCGNCDNNGGFGCFTHRTSAILRNLDDSPIETRNKEEILHYVNEEKELANEVIADIMGETDESRRQELYDWYRGLSRSLGDIVSQISKGIDPRTEKATVEESIRRYREAKKDAGRTRFQGDTVEAERQYNEVVARYKGTSEWLKAPNGQPTKLTERQWVQVRTPAFKAWFGDWESDPANASKVVDENGEPKVVYHGTDKGGFEVFDISKAGTRTSALDAKLGSFFHEDYDYANMFADYGRNKGSQLYAVFLNIRNPLTDEIVGYSKPNDVARIKEKIEQGNHDGIIDLVGEHVVFSPEQIKSATDNVGTFSQSNPSILFQSAYHGSGASFDKFDTDFMGTGEGAQAFGWGIYLTQSEGIARDYAEQRHSNIVYKGDNWNALWNKDHTREVSAALDIVDLMEAGNTFQEARDAALERANREVEEIRNRNKEEDTGDVDWDEQIRLYEGTIEALGKLEERDFSQRNRNLYTVTIPDDTGSNYLYWDKNVSDNQLNTIIENLKKDPTADKKLLDLFEDAMKKGKKSWVKWREGANVYEHIEEILGSPKAASEFLSSLGYVGIDYPANSMSGGNKYGKRNFVIFNADDISINSHLRWQNKLTDDERATLVEEAREFKTFDEFLNYLSIMNGWLDPTQYSDALDVLDEIYGEAHGETRDKAKVDIDLSGLTDDEKDRAFEEYIDGDGVKVIMSLLHDMYTTYEGFVNARGGLQDIAEESSLRARVKEFENNASFIYNLAKNKELTDKQLDSIRDVMKKNIRMYRELIADTLETETLQSNAEPEIKGARTEERPVMSDAEKADLEREAEIKLDDKVEGEIEKKLEALDKELSDDEKAAEALEREIEGLMGELKGELTPEEMKALKELKYLDRLAHRKDEYAKALKKKIDNGEAISQAENTRLETVAKKLKELEGALAKFHDKQKAQAYLDKENALKELREKIKASQRRRRALKEMHEYKGKLVSYLQRKVPKSVAYEYKGMIEAIIAMFNNVSGYDNNITYRGKSLTPKEFREAVDKDGALDELSKYQLRRYEGKSLADYTVEELERMADVKKRLVDVGRQMWQAKVDARNAEAAQIRQIILNHLRKNPKFTTAPLPDTQEDKKQKKTFRKKFSEIFTRTIPMSRITQMLDGGEKGFIYDLLTRDKRLVQDMERLAVRERINKIQNLMDELGVKKDFYTPVELSIRQSDDLGTASEIEKYTDTYNLGQLIYGKMAQRNIRNKQAFMFGDLVTQDEKAILNHNNDAIYDLGMKRNQRFVEQAEEILKKYPKLMEVADAIVKDWQDINNKSRLNQVMIDEYNQGLDMEDFYMPIKRLDFNGTSLAQSIADDVFNQNAGKSRTTPKKGMTYARIDISPDHQKRTNMDFLELWLNSVDEQEHLIATNAYVRKLNRVFKGRGSDDMRSAIENIYGKHITEDIDKYINDFANPPSTTEDRNVSKWIRFLRGRLYEAYLGFKLSSFVLQVITSPAPFLREVNALKLSEYILKMAASPAKYWEFITERSTMMESRSIDPILAEIKKEKDDFTANKFKRGYHKALAFGTGLLEVADRWMVSAGWLACFEKAMGERQEAIDNGTMTQMQAELESAQYADEVVLETQPTGDSTELAPIFKTGSAAWQALTQFTTSLNVIWTNLVYDARTDLQNRNFKRAIMTAFAYALAGTVLYAVQDYEPPEDDEHWIKDTMLKLLYGMTSQGVSSVPLIGSGLEKLSKQLFTGEKQMMSQRVFPAFETAREAIERMASGKMDAKAVRKSIEALGLFFGLPVSGAKELEHIFWDRSGNLRYKGKRITNNELLDFILKEKWDSVLGRRDNYGNKQHRK